MMPRRPGEITPRRAAQILGVHRNTIYSWCDAALNGEPCILPRDSVRRTVTKRLWLVREVIVSLSETA